MTALLVLVSLYLVFFMYLMFAGAGLMRTLSVLRVAAWQSSLAGLVVGVVVALFSVAGGAQAFLTVMTFMSLLLLPTAALSRARDFVLPSSSALEAVCLNVLVLAMGGPAHSFPFLDTFFVAGYHLLLNPFVLLMPPSLALALSLWPSVLALRVAGQGRHASRRSRFFLNLWVQLVSILWVLPAAIGTFRHFKAGSLQAYVEAVFACLGLVYVVLTWMTLRDAVFARRTTMEGERSIDSTEGVGVARALADRMDAGRLHPRVLVAAGLLTYFAIWRVADAFPRSPGRRIRGLHGHRGGGCPFQPHAAVNGRSRASTLAEERVDVQRAGADRADGADPAVLSAAVCRASASYLFAGQRRSAACPGAARRGREPDALRLRDGMACTCSTARKAAAASRGPR